MAEAPEHDDEDQAGAGRLGRLEERDERRRRLEALLPHLYPRWLWRRGWSGPIEVYIDEKARNIARRNYRSRTGLGVRKDRVHEDHEVGGIWHACSDDYMRAYEAGLHAQKDHDPDRPGGMSLHAFILGKMWKAGNDTSSFRAGTTMPKSIIYAYLAAALADDDVNAQRIAWLDMGYDGHLFDQVHGIINWVQPNIPGTVVDGESIEQEAPAEGSEVVDPEFEGQLRLFETEDLTEVERLIYKYGEVWGFTNAEIDDMIPDSLLPKAPSPSTREQNVSKIRAEALRKRAKFFNYTDESDS